MYKVIKKNAIYYLVEDEKKIEIGETFAFCFDKELNVLLKYGMPSVVKGHYDIASKRFSGLCFIEGEFDVEEINKCISICDYIGKFYQKVQNER